MIRSRKRAAPSKELACHAAPFSPPQSQDRMGAWALVVCRRLILKSAGGSVISRKLREPQFHEVKRCWREPLLLFLFDIILLFALLGCRSSLSFGFSMYVYPVSRILFLSL